MSLVTAILATVSMAIPFLVLWLIIFALRKLHIICDWEYRNPANRTCRKCGKHQHQYQYFTGALVWEDMS